MGTPVSDVSHDPFVEMMIDPRRKVTEKVLHERGIDKEMLQRTFDEKIRPRLKEMSLHPFGEGKSDGLKGSFSRSLVEGKLAKFKGTPSVIILNQLEFRTPCSSESEDDTLESSLVKLWLLRDGGWIVWIGRRTHDTASNQPSDYDSEQCDSFSTIGDMLLFLEAGIPDGSYQLGSRPNHQPKQLPLMILRSLIDVVQDKETQLARRHTEMHKLRKEMEAVLAAVKFDAQ